MSKLLQIFFVLGFIYTIPTHGQSLEVQPTPSLASLKGIAFYNATTGYAVGDSSTIVKTIDGGKTWSKLSKNNSLNLWDIKIVPGANGNTVIAVGDGNRVMKTTDAGSAWKNYPVPFKSGSFLFGIECFDSLNYVACGGDFNTVSGAIAYTTNGGSKWIVKPVASSGFIDKAIVSGNKIVCVGAASDFSGGVIAVSNPDSTFTVTHNAPNIVLNLKNIAPNVIIASGDFGQIWKSIDNGNTWKRKDNNEFSGSLWGIEFEDQKHGFIFGGLPDESVILRTDDSGETWRSINNTVGIALSSVNRVGNTYYACGDGGKILKMTNSPTSVEVESLQGLGNTVSPNPATNIISLPNEIINDTQITIHSLTGSTYTLSETHRTNERTYYSVENIPIGSYIISFQKNNTKEFTTLKFVKVK